MKKLLAIVLGGFIMCSIMSNVVLAKAKDDPDFYHTTNSLIYDDIYTKISLNAKTREMVTLACLSVNHNEELFKEHTTLALKNGVTPIEIKEILYQAAPYIGLPRIYTSLDYANSVFKNEGIKLPLEGQTTVTKENRLEKGIEVQTAIFGDAINTMRKNAPNNQKDLQDHLSAYCFGDTYTRKGLDLKQRELITFTVIAALGGCEGQLKAHTLANISEGATKKDLIDTLVTCMPYNGFPRTLNALAIVNEVVREQK